MKKSNTNNGTVNGIEEGRKNWEKIIEKEEKKFFSTWKQEK